MTKRTAFLLSVTCMVAILSPAAQAFSFRSLVSDVAQVISQPIQSVGYALGLISSIPSNDEDVLNGCDNITQVKFSNPKNNKGATKYPIVMAHGMFGFDQLLGVDYWYQITNAMADVGANIYVTQQSAFSNTIMRGDQLLSKVRCILAMEGADKVNLIGHSQGALDARYVAGEAPEIVASVTSMQGVNYGANFSRMYDLPGVDVNHPMVQSLLLLGEAGGRYLDLWTGAAHYEQDGEGLASPESGTIIGDNSFNEKYPGGIGDYCKKNGSHSHNGIRYYSWGGVSPATNILDPFTIVTSTLHALWSLPYGEKSDGLVSQCSSHLGKVLKDNYHLDHFDGANQFLGLKGWRSPNPPTIYRIHAKRLKKAGL